MLDLIEYLEKSTSSTRFDKLLRRLYRYLAWKDNRDERRIASVAFTSFVLALGDQQLITGFAILAAGWVRSSQETLYHYGLIIDLAWISITAQNYTLITLSEHLETHHEMRSWRCVLMIANFVMLFPALFYSGSWTWNDGVAYPAKCEFDAIHRDPSLFAGKPAAMACLNMFILVTIYVESTEALFPGVFYPMTACYRAQIRPHLVRFFSPCTRSYIRLVRSHEFQTRKLLRALQGCMLMLCRFFHMLWKIYQARAFGVIILQALWFSLSNWGIWDRRRLAHEIMEGDEDRWGFGQLVAVWFVVLPLWSFMNTYFRK